MSAIPPTRYDGPLPEMTADSRPYWDGLRAHELRLQRCTRCRTLRHYPRPLCAQCYAFDCDWTVASGRGRVHSWTVAHHAFHPAFKRELPYAIVTVDLEEGVRMAAPLIGAGARQLRIGQPVEVEFEDVSPDLTLPRLRLLEPVAA